VGGREENRKVGSFLRKIVSCFLIDMKFISKLLEIFTAKLMSGDSSSLTFYVSRFRSFPNIKNSRIQNITIKKTWARKCSGNFENRTFWILIFL
jgi:hypothetical protein